MARLVRVVHIDDIDGAEGARPVDFSIDGQAYTIDLTEQNEAELRRLLQPYLDRAEKVGRKRGQRKGAAAQGTSTAKVRAWAVANGYKVSTRGRVPADILAAYEAAH